MFCRHLHLINNYYIYNYESLSFEDRIYFLSLVWPKKHSSRLFLEESL